MFIGHFGLALGAKKAAPAASLGTLFAASQFADLLWPTLVLLDYIVRRPDLPLTLTAADRFGLGLWNSVPATLAIELIVFGGGLLVYLHETTPRDRDGSAGLWALAVFMLAVYVASTFGPPPPGAAAVAWSAEAMWLLVVWGYWVDSHRIPQRNRARA